MNELMTCTQMHKTFQHPSGTIPVLRGIDFSIQKGEMVAILGRSGTGKSTFLHILGTLDRPTQGRVCFKGEDLSQFSDHRLADFRNRHMGFVFQFHYLLPEFNTIENVMMPAWIAGQNGSDVQQRAKELLSIVHMDHRMTHRPNELSGGEQQRVSLARALMRSPELILTDELTGNLDSKTGREVLNYLQKMNRELGITVVSVTHQNENAQQYYSRLLSMEDGILRPFEA